MIHWRRIPHADLLLAFVCCLLLLVTPVEDRLTKPAEDAKLRLANVLSSRPRILNILTAHSSGPKLILNLIRINVKSYI